MASEARSLDIGRSWRMAIEPDGYDRGPLTQDELALLEFYANAPYPAVVHTKAHADMQQRLVRLTRPLIDVIRLRTMDDRQAGRVVLLLMREMWQYKRSFWEWSEREWFETIGSSHEAYRARHGRTDLQKNRVCEGRPAMRDVAYLLCGASDLRSVGMRELSSEHARAYFGAETFNIQTSRVVAALGSGGYSTTSRGITRLRGVLSMAFLLNRSPLLEDLTHDMLIEAGRDIVDGVACAGLIARALVKLGLLPEGSVPFRRIEIMEIDAQTHPRVSDLAWGVPDEWLQWCQAWRNAAHRRKASRLANRTLEHYYTRVLIAGRWLKATHPGITSPEQWTEDIAAEYVDYLCTSATVGQYVLPTTTHKLERRGLLGKPLEPTAIDSRLIALRRFMNDLQNYPHAVSGQPPRKLPLRFKPETALETPADIKKRINPDPRDIDQAIWRKLQRAAARLAASDLRQHNKYPFLMVKAIALLWVTAARRSNEIGRLRLHCVRGDWDPDMLDENGDPISEDARLAYLQVPKSKTRPSEFWVPIPTYTADAILAWEAVRPEGQQPVTDWKDGQPYDPLFCYRDQTIGATYINDTLIPILCDAAGVPYEDARGMITSHRGRSSRATELLRGGLTYDELGEVLGHADASTAKSYARKDEIHFARQVRKADDKMRTVELLLDTHALAEGKPSAFFFLGYGPDKRPRYCASPAWERCSFRMMCPECQMHVDAEQAEEIEGRPGVYRWEARIPMAPEEKAITDGKIEEAAQMIEAKRQAGITPPDPPSPAYCFNHKAVLTREKEMKARQLAAMEDQLTEAERQKKGRNILITALKNSIARLRDEIAGIERGPDELDDTGTPVQRRAEGSREERAPDGQRTRPITS